MSEVGVIGQMYEDRRTKKRGKLVERDEKFKTLLLESDDGKSFNITFGGFKSNWRKVDEPEQTVEEAMTETVPEEEIIANEPVKSLKKLRPEKLNVKGAEGEELFNKMYEQFQEYIKSFNTNGISLSYANGRAKKDDFIGIKLGKRKFIDFYFRKRGYFWIMMPEFVYGRIMKKVELLEVVNTPKNKREISCRLMYGNILIYLESIRPIIVELLSSAIEEG